jgi:hypothetical protein
LQPQDLLTLYFNFQKALGHSALTEAHLKRLGWSDETFECSQENLKKYGLVDRDNSKPKFDRIQIFLTEAISFWWPIKDQNQPLFEELPQLMQEDQDLKKFFTQIELLRYDSHPQKNRARLDLIHQLKGIKEIVGNKYPNWDQDHLDLPYESLQLLFQYICQNGFRSLTFSKASELTEIPLQFFKNNWDTEQALRIWIASQSHQEFYLYLAPLIGQMQTFNKGHLAHVFEKYLDNIEDNEPYYRILLWGYLENDASLQEMSRRSQLDYFETILVLFKKSKPEAKKQAEFYAYLFTSLWKIYASFVWCDSKTLKDRLDLTEFRSHLRTFLVESVFEKF